MHHITGWECDLSSQTGASQAGILHGNNSDMPAFCWFDKESSKVFRSNRPKDAAEIERQRSDGHGLLADGGVPRSNVFSGDSPDSMLTCSTVTDRGRPSGKGFTYFVSSRYAPFGPNAADHVRRTDSFANCPDLLVNSFFDAAIDEGAAFEELIGFQGGLGGKQTESFLLSQRSFTFPDGPIVGAEAIHHILKGWLRAGADPGSTRPWETPSEPPALSAFDGLSTGA